MAPHLPGALIRNGYLDWEQVKISYQHHLVRRRNCRSVSGKATACSCIRHIDSDAVYQEIARFLATRWSKWSEKERLAYVQKQEPALGIGPMSYMYLLPFVKGAIVLVCPLAFASILPSHTKKEKPRIIAALRRFRFMRKDAPATGAPMCTPSFAADPPARQPGHGPTPSPRAVSMLPVGGEGSDDNRDESSGGDAGDCAGLGIGLGRRESSSGDSEVTREVGAADVAALDGGGGGAGRADRGGAGLPDTTSTDAGRATAAAGSQSRVLEVERAPRLGRPICGREVGRISVHDKDARDRVIQARMNGTPVVLTRHVGWAGFAARWLRKKSSSNDGDEEEGEAWKTPLDLSEPDWYLDAQAMADDIGNEEVQYKEPGSDEVSNTRITVSRFLDTSWSSSTGGGVPEAAASSALHRHRYLHQWQFPRSKSAALKLCRKGAPRLDIVDDNLLEHWLDLIPGVNNYQYLFMGREDTMTELHKDPGGLAITIAPIVGKKECELTHRADDDLRWKTVIKPGEILLMPQGTWHACRNVTPCLSYSCLHLDLLNMDAFIDSFFAEDAKEQEHAEVLWQATEATMNKISAFLGDDLEKPDWMRQIPKEDPLDPSLVRLAATLGALRVKVSQFRKRLAEPSNERLRRELATREEKERRYTLRDFAKLEEDCAARLHVLCLHGHGIGDDCPTCKLQRQD